MIETERPLATADGTMSTFVVHPDEDGPHPVVLFYMDAPGKREELHDMARRIASTGYYVMLPQLYYRTVDTFELDFTSKESYERMSELMYSLSNRMIVSDTATLLATADADPAADATAVGCVGYCMSGPFALSVAAAYPDRITAAASIYGVRLAIDADDSPHLAFADTPGELYIACAEFDNWVDEPHMERIEAAMDASGNRGRVERYPGVHHGFAFPNREAYDKPAAERHWQRLHALFARNLSGRG